MIRLKSVEIDGFITSTQKVKLEFVDSNVICIYGDNGSGKTTFLEILYAVFAEDEEKLKKFDITKISIEFLINRDVNLNKNIEYIIEEIEKNLKKEEKKLRKIEKEIKENDDILSVKVLQLQQKQKELNNIESYEETISTTNKEQIVKMIKEKKQDKEKLKVDRKLNSISEEQYSKEILKLNIEIKFYNNLLDNENIKSNKKLQSFKLKEIKGEINLINEKIDEIEKEKSTNILKIKQSKIEIDRLKDNIDKLKNPKIDLYRVSIEKKTAEDNEDKTFYNWSKYKESILSQFNSIFLGIGRGIHKKELNISTSMLFHFFNSNKQISDNKKLNGEEIDSLTKKLKNYLNENKKLDVEDKEENKIKSLIKEKNIFLPNIEINEVEEILKKQYKNSVIAAKDKIDQNCIDNSIDFLDDKEEVKENIDIQNLTNKLEENSELLIEIYEDRIDKIINYIRQDKDYLANLDINKLKVLSNMLVKTNLQEENKIFKTIKEFIKIYNDFLDKSGKKLILKQDRLYIKTNEDKEHFINKLSSGERHLLTFFATILLLSEEQDFILLDEPEISLNVDWQRKILSTIAKLAPNSQIIVATHSPLVVEEHPNSLLEIKPVKM